MSALDSSVVNTILPVLRRTFNSDIAAIEWVVTVYLLVISGLLLSFGRLGDMRGNKAVYVGGFGVFVVSSMVCGLAPTVSVLVAARSVQALGGAMLAANSPAILTKTFPSSRRGQALGIQAMITYLGLVVGPSLGGWLATQLSWRAVFYINVPVGLLALLLSLKVIPGDATHENQERFDFAGAALFTAGLMALLLGLNRGHIWGWASPVTLGVLALALGLLAVFVVIESRVPDPMLDLSLFRVRVFSAATVSAILNYVCLYSIVFLMPFYLIQGRGLTAAQAGAILTGQPLVMALVAPLSGALSDKLGSRLLSTLGMGVLACALFLYSRLGAGTSLTQVMLTMACSGLGVGLFASPNTSALMGAASRRRQGIAASIMATARTVGMALGIGFTGAVFNTVLAQGTPAGASSTLFAATHVSFLAVIAVALLGMVTSAVRGNAGTAV
jgi:EmrB/QacA subfamily drug resistance transporter